jgi:hypothetical protein
VDGETISLKLSSKSVISVSLPDGPLTQLKLEYGQAQLTKWARAVLIREAIRAGLVGMPVARALVRAGLTEIVPPDPVSLVGSIEDAA